MLFSHPHSRSDQEQRHNQRVLFYFQWNTKNIKKAHQLVGLKKSQKHLQNWRPWQFTPISYHIITLSAITCNISVISIHVWIYGWMCVSLWLHSFIYVGGRGSDTDSPHAHELLFLSLSVLEGLPVVQPGERLITIIQDSGGAVLSRTAGWKLHTCLEKIEPGSGVSGSQWRTRGDHAVWFLLSLFFWRRGKWEMKTGIGGL